MREFPGIPPPSGKKNSSIFSKMILNRIDDNNIMNNKLDALRFTVEERILIHLLDFTTYRSKIEVSQSITQEGISQSILVQRKHLPRCLKIMKEKNLIQEKITHVIGKKQRMKTYHLTSYGEEKAYNLKKYIINCTIRVRDTRRRLKDTTINDLAPIVKGSYSLAEILSYANSDGVIDLTRPIIKQPEEKIIPNRLEIYKKVLEQAWKDGKMTNDEQDLLRKLRESLNISKKDHLHIEEKILKNAISLPDKTAMEVYKIALKQALADNRISADERAILNKIKKQFHLKDE